MVDNIRSLGSVRNAVWSVTEDNMRLQLSESGKSSGHSTNFSDLCIKVILCVTFLPALQNYSVQGKQEEGRLDYSDICTCIYSTSYNFFFIPEDIVGRETWPSLLMHVSTLKVRILTTVKYWKLIGLILYYFISAKFLYGCLLLQKMLNSALFETFGLFC